jgi:hypothetical protein
MRKQRVFGNASGVTLLAENLSTPTRGMTTRIANTFNSGWQVSDIRRAYLADTDVGSVSGTELVVNGGFDTDLSGWTVNQSTAWVSGAMRLQSNGNPDPFSISTGFTVKPGAVYEIQATFSNPDAVQRTSYPRLSTNAGLSGVLTPTSGVVFITLPAGVTSTFVSRTIIPANTTTAWMALSLGVGSGQSGARLDLLSVSVKEIAADYSYKAQAASITGTLTKSQVA